MENILLKCIDRKRLDFELERVCSVTLSTANVYACLTCGRFLAGRHPGTPAHNHSLLAFEETPTGNHPLYMSLNSGRIFILPDAIEFPERIVKEHLADVVTNLNPHFETPLDLYNPIEPETDLHGRKYVRGFLGMNNICNNSSYANVIIQSLLHVPQLQNYFLVYDCSQRSGNELEHRMQIIFKRYWNITPFKALVNPHEIMQTISRLSSNRFSPLKASPPIDFLSWILNQMPLLSKPLFGGRLLAQSTSVSNTRIERSEQVPFLFLSLDLPPMPLYQTRSGEYITSTVSLSQLMEKYNGGHLTQKGDLFQSFVPLAPAPPYLIINYKRIIRAHAEWEKNKTLITHSLSGLPLTLADGSITSYRLIANIHHESSINDTNNAVGNQIHGKYLVQLVHPITGHWYEIDDINCREIAPITISLSETCIQFWERE